MIIFSFKSSVIYYLRGGGLGGTHEISMFFFDSVPEVSMAAAFFSLFFKVTDARLSSLFCPSAPDGPQVESQRSVPKLKRSFKIKSPKPEACGIFTFKCMCQKLKSGFHCSWWILFSPSSSVKRDRPQWPCGLATNAAQRSVSSASLQSFTHPRSCSHSTKAFEIKLVNGKNTVSNVF